MVTALAVAAAFVFSVSADDVKTGKGKGAVVVPGENVLMTCPHCKDDYVVKLTTPSKGTAPEKAVVGTHLLKGNPNDQAPSLQLGAALTGVNATIEGTNTDLSIEEGFNVLSGWLYLPPDAGQTSVECGSAIARRSGCA